jgi:hypothetical protein
MNFGGFSWKRLVGISAFKSRISRKIGIPLTASGRRRKLGAFIFNAVGPLAGTLAVAAVGVVKQPQESNGATTPSEPPSPKGVFFCQVKGVTHKNDDGTSRSEAMKLCSIGDAVKLVPDPQNTHDRNAIRVLLLSGQQIGYISARQAARFAGKVHLLTATIHSRVNDEWDNETVKLRVLNPAEQELHEAPSSTAGGQSPSLNLISAIQAEAKEIAKKESWQSTLVYFENAEQQSYQVVLAENTEHIRQTLEAGLAQVGFIGAYDAPKGIQFEFTLNDNLPTNGPVAQRFLSNAREWIISHSKDVCAMNGIAPPIVHQFVPSERVANKQPKTSANNSPPSRQTVTPFWCGAVLGIAGLLVGLFTGEWRMTLVIVLFAGFTYGGVQGLVARLMIASIISCLIYQAWWAAGVVSAAAVAFLVWRAYRSADKGAR